MSGHHHDQGHARQGRSLVISIVLNLGFAVAELVFGLMANSLVLVADAIHDASDAVALGLSYFGLKMSERAPNQRRTFGYRKVRILTAFINALVLAGLTVFVVRAAMWHLLEDFLGWVAILVGGIIIRFTGWYVVDPILSLAVSGLVIYGAYSVFRESASILIDSTPHDINFDTVRRYIVDFAPEIDGVHDLHIWTLGEGERALMAHLVVKDANVGSFHPMLARLECALRENFGLNHVTLELECDTCKSGDNVCLE